LQPAAQEKQRFADNLFQVRIKTNPELSEIIMEINDLRQNAHGDQRLEMDRDATAAAKAMADRKPPKRAKLALGPEQDSQSESPLCTPHSPLSSAPISKNRRIGATQPNIPCAIGNASVKIQVGSSLFRWNVQR
jgi:hypothetical protein